ncbi:MAG: pyridoxine 5'-phosphate synthase [Bdellovibrionaceae bacterium]|nr:pyridoxine 5'-phosphate synthase [Pseudobdellovibrionaceae bacterium]
MAILSVNVNKIATLRNARGTDQPHLLQVTQDIVNYGSRGITVHPRPDERHITKKDAYELGHWIKTLNDTLEYTVEYNMEGYPDERFLNMVNEIRPDQCTLVPDPPGVLTSNAGWNCPNQQLLLTDVCKKLRQWGVRSSIFINPYDISDESLQALKIIQPDRTELYTEMYAKAFNSPERDSVTKVYKQAAEYISALNIKLNAGHDLNQNNLDYLIKSIPQIKEVSIGHALICEAIYDGLENTVKKYLHILSCH